MNELSPANYRDFKTMSSSFEAMGAFTAQRGQPGRRRRAAASGHGAGDTPKCCRCSA